MSDDFDYKDEFPNAITEDDEQQNEDEQNQPDENPQSKKQKTQSLKKQHTEDVKQSIKKIFRTDPSPIPTTLLKSLKISGEKTIQKTKQILQDQEIKPEDKKRTISELTSETVAEIRKTTMAEAPLKIAKDFIKNNPYVRIAMLCLAAAGILMILFTILISSIVSAGGGAEESTNAENMRENSSITNEYFYGTRSVYIDDEALADALQLSYKQYVSDVIIEIEKLGIDVKIETISIDEETGEPKQLSDSDNTHYNTLSLNIGNIVAGKSETSFSATLYHAIPYFGLTSPQQSNANTLIVDYIKNDATLYQLTSAPEFPSSLDTSLNNNIALDYIKCCCEKVMIKDEIATEEGLSEIEQRIYIASIYMPNKDITIYKNYTCLTTTTANKPVSVVCALDTNGTTTILASGTTSNDDGKRLLDPIDNINTNVAKFTAIDTENPEAFSGGVSLLELIRTLGKDTFKTVEKENGDMVYSWKPAQIPSMLYMTFDTTDGAPFIFTDLKMSTSNVK